MKIKIPNKGNVFLIVLLSVTLLGLILFLNIRFSYLYKYDIKKDYNYDFSQTNSEVFKLEIKNNEMEVSTLPDNWETAILELNITSTFLGKFLLPRIQMTSGNKQSLQYFENKGNGKRYIDVSSIVRKNEPINFECKNLRLIDQPVNLYLFNNPDIKKAKILVFSPHPDDAEIAAYGLYSNANDSTTIIVTVTAGEAGKKTYDELYKDDYTHFLKKGEIRVWNSISIPLLGGIQAGNAINLGYFDGKLNEMYNNPSKVISSSTLKTEDINHFRNLNISRDLLNSEGVSTWNGLVEEFSNILRITKPDILVAPYPANSNHPDHKLTTIALIEAIKKLGMKEGFLFLYTNDNIPGGNFYPYGDIYSLVPLPPNFQESFYFNSIYSQPLSYNEQNDKLLVLEAMNDLRPDTEWRSSKTSMIRAFRTTFKNIFGLDRSYYRRAIRPNEVFFVVSIENLLEKEVLDLVEGME